MAPTCARWLKLLDARSVVMASLSLRTPNHPRTTFCPCAWAAAPTAIWSPACAVAPGSKTTPMPTSSPKLEPPARAANKTSGPAWPWEKKSNLPDPRLAQGPFYFPNLICLSHSSRATKEAWATSLISSANYWSAAQSDEWTVFVGAWLFACVNGVFVSASGCDALLRKYQLLQLRHRQHSGRQPSRRCRPSRVGWSRLV